MVLGVKLVRREITLMESRLRKYIRLTLAKVAMVIPLEIPAVYSKRYTWISYL